MRVWPARGYANYDPPLCAEDEHSLSYHIYGGRPLGGDDKPVPEERIQERHVVFKLFIFINDRNNNDIILAN